MIDAPAPGARPPRLRSDLMFSVSANAVFALSQWALILILTRLGTPEQVGYLTLSTAIVTPIFVLSNLSLRKAHAVDDLSDNSYGDYFALRIASSTLAVAVAVAVILLAYNDRVMVFVLAALAYVAVKLSQAQSDLNYGIFQARGKLVYVAYSNYLRAIGGAVAFLLAFLATRDLATALIAQTAVWALVVWLVEGRYLRDLGIESRFRLARQSSPRAVAKLFWWMAPLAIAGLLQNIGASVPRIVLGEYVDFAALGVFGAMAYFQTAMRMFIVAVGQAGLTRMARHYRHGRRAGFKRVTLRLLAMNALIGIVLLGLAYLFGERVVALLYGPAYVNFALMMLVAGAIAASLIGSVLNFGVTASRRFDIQLAVNAVALAASVALTIWLVPAYGIVGAGGVLLGNAVVLAMAGFVAFLYALRQMPPPAEEPAHGPD